MMSPTVIRGSRDANGSWKIICIFRRTRRSFAPRILVISWPSNVILPPVTGSKAVINRASVDFPQPDSPTSPSASPRRISRSTPSTARTARPPLPNPTTGKCLYAPWTRSSTGSVRTAVAGCRSAACTAITHFRRRDRLQLLRRIPRQGALLRRVDVLFLHVAHQHPAPCGLVEADFFQLRLLDLAPVDHKRASRVELTAGRRVQKVGRKARSERSVG